jgi:transposase, IS30 family
MKKYKQLDYKERTKIEVMHNKGLSIRLISSKLKRSPSTIGRELKRNVSGSCYVAHLASHASRTRGSIARSVPRKMNKALKKKLKSLLKKGWGPEQISGRLNLQGIKISTETIYQWIWENKQQQGKLYRLLKRRGRTYRKRKALYENRGQIRHRVDIDERPAVVDQRSRVGDWEIDSIVGKGHRGAIISMVERNTRFTKIIKVNDRTAARVAVTLIKGLRKFKSKVLTITSDNGKEFAYHQHVSNALDANFYFAKPYSAWQRGTNENTNGLVRYYLPKGTNFCTVTHKDIQNIEDKLNNRPRKCLGYKTPKELMDAALAA